MVTSAIATPALPAVNEKRANARCIFSCNDKMSMEITPREPERKHQALSGETIMLYNQFLIAPAYGKIKSTSLL